MAHALAAAGQERGRHRRPRRRAAGCRAAAWLSPAASASRGSSSSSSSSCSRAEAAADPAFGVDNQFGETPQAGDAQEIPAAQDPERDLKDFSSYVFIRVQDTWEEIFQRAGRQYERAKLVLYRGGVSTGCGSASSAVGPFYCPADQRVYIDLSFWNDMEQPARRARATSPGRT